MTAAQESSAAQFALDRRNLHSLLVASGVWSIDSAGVVSNADKSNVLSRTIAWELLAMVLDAPPQPQRRLAGQTLGTRFEMEIKTFLERTFVARLGHLRPGKWSVHRLGNTGLPIAAYEQYAHLQALETAAQQTPGLAAILGIGYAITPDVVILREPEPDSAINTPIRLVDEHVSTRSSLRASTNDLELLHASISCKWTMRSDRAQNARTEALNLMRNRKGHLPHVAVVTAEPLPSRLASIALGTGDVDCTYHLALDELIRVVEAGHHLDALDMLQTMVDGKRLKDIADLPLDLAI